VRRLRHYPGASDPFAVKGRFFALVICVRRTEPCCLGAAEQQLPLIVIWRD